MTGQQLKDSILLSAFSGAFVEQHNYDMSIFQRIVDVKKEQEKLIKAKKIKKEKYNPAISERDNCLPNNWTIIKLGDISKVITKQTGFDYSNHIKPNLVDCPGNDDIPMLQTRNFKGKVFDFHTEYYISKRIASSFPKICLDEPCLLLSIVGASIGNVGYLEQPREAIIGGAICKVTIIPTEFYEYLFYYLQSPQGRAEIKKNLKATAQGTITVQDVREIEVPLPPYEEQCRIVKKIEALFPLVDEYEKAAVELNTLNELLPDKFRKSILQEAIHGNLVPNDIPDGEATAQELLQQILKERQDREDKAKGKKTKKLSLSIIEDEPWDLPEGWCWCNLGDIVLNRDSERIPLSVDVRSRQQNKQYDYYGPGGAFDKVEGYLFDKRLLLIGEDGANLLTRNKPNAFFAEGKYWVNNHVHVLDSFIADSIILDYVALRINGMSLADYVTGTAQPKMNQEKMNSIPIPLPPLSIQHRIVEKIEEVFAVIDRL